MKISMVLNPELKTNIKCRTTSYFTRKAGWMFAYGKGAAGVRPFPADGEYTHFERSRFLGS